MKQHDDHNIVYLYVNKFKFKNKKDEYELGGHPFVGRVYRAFKTEVPSTVYEIHVGQENTPSGLSGLGVKSLVSSSKDWEYDMAEITMDNYSDFMIHQDDIKKMSEWEENQNEDLIALKAEGIQPVPTSSSSKSIEITNKNHSALMDAIMEAMEAEEELTNKSNEDWPEFRASVIEVLDYLEETFSDKYAGADITTKNFINSKNYGKGFNCGNALKYLSRYCTEDFSKSNNKVDLFKAIHYLLFEITRRNTHEQ